MRKDFNITITERKNIAFNRRTLFSSPQLVINGKVETKDHDSNQNE